MWNKEEYITRIKTMIAENPDHPSHPLDDKAIELWCNLLNANEYTYIDTNDWDDPTDAPNYIAVITHFLEKEGLTKSE